MNERVLLITKLVTTNIGNQALSDEVIKLYEKGSANLVVVGRPEGLYGYSLEKLQKSADPVGLFECWTDKLVSNLKNTENAAVTGSSQTRVRLLSFDNFKVRNDNFFQAIKNIFRKYVHSDSLFAKAYRDRFRKISAVDSIVYSGAGEVGDNNIFLRQLLELRVAQKIRKKTYAINQSIEVVESPMKEICGLVYKEMNKIVVRGIVSRDNIIALGVSANKIECYPDSAFLNPLPSHSDNNAMKARYQIEQPAVAINATKVADDMSAWGDIISLLKTYGYNIYFVSNDPFGDKEIGERLSSQFELKPILEFIDYPQYAALLGNFDFVISCRLHTNELALTAGTPIIPIEGSHFKTREVFNLVQYPLSVANTSSSNWSEVVKDNIKNVISNRSAVQAFVDNLNTVRSLSMRNCLV